MAKKYDPEAYSFVLDMDVRDYELDIQGIVNNANYLHYLEHTRHEFCNLMNLSFSDMHNMGIDTVLSHVDISYHKSLVSGDKFHSCLNLRRKGPRFIFEQDIFRFNGDHCISAKVAIVAVENGRLSRGDMIAERFARFIKND